MKKILTFLFLSVFLQNTYSFSLSSIFRRHDKYENLSQEELIKKMVDNTYQDKIGLLDWFKNIISFARESKSKKLDEVVSSIIIFDNKSSEDQLLEKNIKNLMLLVFYNPVEKFYKRNGQLPPDCKEEGFCSLADYKKELEDSYYKDDSEYCLSFNDYKDIFREHHPLTYAIIIDNEFLAKVFLDMGIRLKDCFNLEINLKNCFADLNNPDRERYYNFNDFLFLFLMTFGKRCLNLIIDDYTQDVNYISYTNGDLGSFRLIEIAAWAGHIDIVKKLIAMGADCKRIKNTYSISPFIAAIKIFDLDLVRLLLENGADINDNDEAGDVALQIAIEREYFGLVKYLIDNGAFIFDEFLFIDCDDKIKNYVKENIKDKNGLSLLHISALLGDIDKVKELLDNGFDPNIKDIHGRTPIHVIIENNCHIKDSSDFHSHLDSPVYRPVYINIIDLLLKSGADVDELDFNENTPLIYAAYFGADEFFNHLLEKGADIKKVNKFGISALAYIASQSLYNALYFDKKVYLASDERDCDLLYYISAVYCSNSYFEEDDFLKNCSKEYLDKILDNFNLNTIYFKDGINVLHIAIAYSNEYMVDYWIEKGFDINSIDLEGKSSLFFVNNVDMAKKVLELGCDLSITDSQGRTAVDFLKEISVKNAKIVDVIDFLEKSGSN
ncbi:hypothetical protein GF385_02270 [Candidatus Dependentiae bacterium]|nr:hypothetical protein [Candidatus Dependentiae bacterium]